MDVPLFYAKIVSHLRKPKNRYENLKIKIYRKGLRSPLLRTICTHRTIDKMHRGLVYERLNKTIDTLHIQNDFLLQFKVLKVKNSTEIPHSSLNN